MKLEDIDKNFLQNTAYDEENTTLYDVREKPFSLYGVHFDEEKDCFVRMGKEAEGVSVGYDYGNHHTAGGRIRFATDSSSLTIIVRYATLEKMYHMPFTGNVGFALCDNDEEEIFRKILAPVYGDETGYVRQVPLKGKMQAYTLYFPLYNGVKSVYIGLDKGAKVEEGKAYERLAPILYYGSSITQGGCASRPDTCYQGFIAKRNNVDYINLGFSGSAKAEERMIDYMASLDCSLFVYDYDHNAPSVEYLQETHYRGYERYREKKPTTPILFISKPDLPLSEDSAKRAAVIQASYEKAKGTGDENAYFIDGRTLFEKEWENCTVDGCHPTDFGFYQMSLKIGAQIDEILKIKK